MTRFTLEIPDPAVMRVGKEGYFVLPAGAALHRIHRTQFQPSEFNGTLLGDARFSPIRDAAGSVIPTIYGAESFECAACEIILRCPDTPPLDPKTGLPTFQIVFPSDFSDHRHSVVHTTLELKLVELTAGGQRRIGVDGDTLLAGPRSTYPTIRAWAEQIHQTCPGAHGLYYNSFQFGPQFAVLLFGDRVPAGVLSPGPTRLVKDAPCHAAVTALAAQLSIDYEDI